MTFDPFTASPAEWMSQPDPALAARQCAGARRLIDQREYFERVPIDGVAVCALHCIAMPQWLADAFLAGHQRVANFEVRALDDAFPLPRAKGFNLAHARRRQRLLGPVAALFSETLNRDPGRAVDKLLWEEIGSAFSVSATLAEEIYREGLRTGLAMTAAEVRNLATSGGRVVFGNGLTTGQARLRASSPAKFRKLAGVRRKR